MRRPDLIEHARPSDGALRRLRAISPLVFASSGLLVVGALLLAFKAVLAGEFAIAVAVLLLAGGLGLAVLKLDSLGRAAHQSQRRLSALSNGMVELEAKVTKCTTATEGAPPATVRTNTAAVPVDPGSERLLRASNLADDPETLVVGAVPPSLASDHGSCPAQLFPGTCAAQVARDSVHTLVIQETALAYGPWAGALEPHGQQLLGQLLKAISAIASKGGRSFVVTDDQRFFSRVLRAAPSVQLLTAEELPQLWPGEEVSKK